MIGATNQKQILIVDDEPGLREVMALELEMNGFKVLTAPNGRKAYELIEAHPVAMVISDVRMPDGDGLELLQKLKEREKLTGEVMPVLLMSGYSGITREEAQARGALEMFNKPFMIEELLSLIFSHPVFQAGT